MNALAVRRGDEEGVRSPARPDRGEPRLVLRALGPTAVTDRGRPLPLPRGRATALLAWLLAHRTSGVSVAATLVALWPHLDEAAGARELRRNLALLREQLAPAHVVVVRRGGDLSLVSPAAAAVDVEVFEGRLAAAEQARVRGAHGPALTLVRHALALWRGDEPFVDIRDTAIGADESVRLGGLRQRAIDLRDGLRLQVDPDSRLLADLEAKVAVDPAHELGWRQLMVALDQAGHRADALRAFQACRRSLQRGGQAPAGETRRVEAALLAGRAPEPDLYLPQPETPAGVGGLPAGERRGVSPPRSALEALVDAAWAQPARAMLAVVIGGRRTAGDLAGVARRRGGEAVVLRASDHGDGGAIPRSVREGVPSALIVDGADRAPARLLGAVGDLRRGPGPLLVALVTDPRGVAHLSELILHADRVLEHPTS